VITAVRRDVDHVAARAFAGVRVIETTVGCAVNEMAVPTDLLDERGTVAAGALAILADGALGLAIMSTFALGRGMASSHLHLDLVAPLEPGTPVLRGVGRCVSLDDRYGLAEGEITTTSGAVVARAAVGTVLLDGLPAPRQPAAAATVPPAEPHRLVDASPVHETLGTRIVAAGERELRALVRADARFANSGGGVHGGFGVLMGERVLDLALRAALDGRAAMHPVELRAVFLRPIAADGASVECAATVVHLGHRLAAARAEVRDHGGRPAVLVDATYLAD
jgi:uncharacterized protein (TIGR00369 family)